MDLLAQLKKSTVVHLCLAISFFTSGLIINIVQCILFYGLKPFNKSLYRSIGYYLCYSLYSQMVFIADWWSNSKLYVYVDPEIRKKYLGKEHVLLMMNHTYDIDWLIGWMLTDKVVIGWSWKFAEFVFLERSFEKDKEIIGTQINEIFDYPDPVWLLLSAEGTRFTEKKHEASVKFAQERGMQVLKHHLIPRTKGFTASLPYLKKKCPCILDIQLAFKKTDPVEPTIGNLLHGKSVTGHMLVRRIDMQSLPDNEQEASEWVQELFREKDAIQDSFHTHGDFFTGTGITPIEPVLQVPRIWTLANLVFWAVATLIPIFYYLIILLFTGKIWQFLIGVAIISGVYILMQKTIGMSKISRGSSYGSSPSKSSS